MYKLVFQEIKDYAQKIAADLPVGRSVWHPFGFAASNFYLFNFLFYFLQILPGWFLDTLLIIFRKEPM